DRDFARRWWNWQEFMDSRNREPSPRVRGEGGPDPERSEGEGPDEGSSFEDFERVLHDLYDPYTFAFAEKESGIPAATIEQVAEIVASAGHRLSTHTW